MTVRNLFSKRMCYILIYTEQHRTWSICANCEEGNRLRWVAKDGQRDTLHYVLQCDKVHNRTLQSHKCNNRLSNRMTCWYLINYYVRSFTHEKPEPMHPIWYNFTRCGCNLTPGPGHWLVWQVTLANEVKCHSTISWKWLRTGFRATVWALTGDNWFIEWLIDWLIDWLIV